MMSSFVVGLHLSTPFVWFQELHHGPKETKIEEKDTLEWSAVYRNQEKAKQEEMGRYAYRRPCAVCVPCGVVRYGPRG